MRVFFFQCESESKKMAVGKEGHGENLLRQEYTYPYWFPWKRAAVIIAYYLYLVR